MVAENTQGYAKTEHSINGNVKEDRLRRIAEVLNNLEHTKSGGTKVKPDWKSEIEYILKGNGPDIPVTVRCDLYTENRDDKKNAPLK